MDIVIYMNEADFGHKTSLPVITAYWSMGRVPSNERESPFKEGDRIFMAAKGEVRGSVECLEFNREDINGETIVWDSDTYIGMDRCIKCKPFRGFRYRWFECKVENTV
ncbi:unnamed protein product [marine sediment metagenome]|uniref:Uncharacterized protein n=1 Tax=marine sediment metagenome TaxID=412755 RepID=X0SQU4_9ZZZZ